MNRYSPIIFAILSLLSGLLTGCQRGPDKEHAALTALPGNILWAWERPEDLRWLPTNVGVAYVATSLSLLDDRAEVRPRANALKVRPDTSLIPVVHVDASWRHPPALSGYQRDIVVNQILRTAEDSGASVIQLDFEVRRSQRPFLLDIVKAVRRQLPADRALSVTALASWCAGDYWLAAMPVNEIVPMAFRMARDDAPIRKMLAERGGFQHKQCQAAAGFATDEPIPQIHTGRHYFFSPTAWKPDDWLRISRSTSNKR